MKGFTLIELIAVLVILAIIALIVTPLVMSIIRKSRVSADKRSVDAYGRSIELAIAGYLLDNGKFPTEVSQLTIEYSGNKVECETTQINSDSSVYLAGCTVAGRSVEGYTYGKEETISYDVYSVGDEVTYNGVDYYVIKDSDASEESVTLLKAEPLSVEEVNQYGVGHVNRYTQSSAGTAYNQNGYGGMAYYSSETCGDVGYGDVQDGCVANYESSDINFAVEAWANDKILNGLQDARLITVEELESLGYLYNEEYGYYPKLDNVPNWLYNSNYNYWTMSSNDSNRVGTAWAIYDIGDVGSFYVNNILVVRPVIVISKTVLN